MNLAEIPSPTTSVWHLGPLPIRAYALCIIAGMIAACVVTEIRMRRRGAPPYAILDVAVWAVPFGIIGARIYHVITSPEDYFGVNGDPSRVFRIWEGGLGIWGGVAGGALGAWFAARRLGIPLTFVADALAPGLPLAQGIGRWGNWFNNELYGGHTNRPWGLRVYDFDLSVGRAVTGLDGQPIVTPGGPFHPTFLYESLWDVGVALLVWQADRMFKFGKGRAFALYVMAYTVGRFWVEALRSDPAHHVLGMRLNNWVSIVVFLGALLYFVLVRGPREYLIAGADGALVVVTEERATRGSGPDAEASTPPTEPTDPADSAEPTNPAEPTEPDDSPDTDQDRSASRD